MSEGKRRPADTAVWEAAQRLLNELCSAMRVFEVGMRDAMGDTNFNIITERAADLQAALKTAGEPGRNMSDLMRRIDAAIAVGSGIDPRQPYQSPESIFRDHACWKCKDGQKPCVRGAPHRCDYPQARNE